MNELNILCRRLVSKSRKPVVILCMLFATPLFIGNISATESISATMEVKQNNIKVSGTVIDTSGEPLIGVSVLVEGTTSGTVTDVNGKYSITVANTDVNLVFTYIGFVTQKRKVGDDTTINIVLDESSQMLSEVVVTALGMKREDKSLGYAMKELKGDELSKNSVNPVNALQGKVAGVDISSTDGGLFGSTKIQIRGSSTLKGNNQPIYIIDGVILDNNISKESSADWNGNADDYGNELKNLNPDDFETVSVLKGAAATALYGSRGLNGAVVITTKGGGKQSGFGVSFSQSVGFDVVNKTADMQNVYGPGKIAGRVDYGDTYVGADGKYAYYKWDNLGQFKLNGSGVPTLVGTSEMAWGPRYDGRSIESYDREMINYSPLSNNMKDAYQTGLSSNTNIVVKGGNDITSYYSSLSYKNANGIVDNNSFNRFSYMLKASHQISDRVKIAGSFTLANSRPKNSLPSIGQNFISGAATSMLHRIYDTKYYRNKYLGNHGGMANSKYGDKYADVPGKSAWFNIYEKSYEQVETSVRPTLDVDVKITDWMSFVAEANMNYYYTRAEKKELGTGYMNEGTDNGTGGYYSLEEREKHQETFAGNLTFNKSLGDFSIGGFLRGEFYQAQQVYLKGETEGGLIIPNYYNFSNSKQNKLIEGGTDYKKRMLSFVFAANLSWKNQLYLDITGRNDWSSALTYPNGTGDNSYYYPSVSGSWLITESFRESLPSWISFAKIRGSWAQVGNDTNPYDISQTYKLNSYPQVNASYVYMNEISRTIYPELIKPERKNAFEVGLDWRFLVDRIGIDLTYYRENTKDQIMLIDVPIESGKKQKYVNAGNIQNQGIEIALNAVPYRSKDLEWTVDLTYTKNENKIISLHPDVAERIALSGDVAYGNYRVGSVAVVGGDYGILMTDSKPARDDNGNILLAWNEITRTAYAKRSGEVEEIGKMTPDFLASFSTGLTYKNLSIRVALDARYGGYIASYSNKYGLAYGQTETSLAYRDAANGGTSWTSQFEDSKGQTFHDGVIPDGVFAQGTKITTPDGRKDVDVSGMSFRDAYEAGLVEPVHASSYTYYTNQWGTGTVNDDWVSEVKYIALREIAVSYRVPKSLAAKIGARGMNVGASVRNLCYLYNSLPNNLHPESVRGSSAHDFRERSYSPYVASYLMNISLDF